MSYLWGQPSLPLKIGFAAPREAIAPLETPHEFATMAETTTPPKPGRKRERDVVVEPELSEYELHRNKRIKANEAFLEALGLGGTGQKLPKKPRAKPKPKRKFEEHEKRKSVRLAGGPAPIERLHDDPRSYDDFVESRKRQKRAPRQEPWEPTDEQRDKLGEFCMEECYDFLGTTTANHKEISPDNRKTVIRQITKLVTGVGVDYHRWPVGVVFRKGEPVTLQDDLAQIKEDAKDFEAQHGRDLGNGWLLNHPLQKMILFRDHLAATKLPGKARKKTKAAPAPSSDDDEEEAAAAPPEAKPAKGTLTPETVRAIREAKERFDEGEIDEATFKETKAGLLMVGRQVRKRFPGSGWFDGVIESVEEDGRCKIAWSDGDVTSMKVGAVAKILKD